MEKLLISIDTEFEKCSYESMESAKKLVELNFSQIFSSNLKFLYLILIFNNIKPVNFLT
ncbi:MAG: hypothetical protein ABF289_00235 [Clostridiales bacterium]